jgi:predicted nucleotidyltransferase
MKVQAAVVSVLRADPAVRLAVVFGSHARGSQTPDSDLDVAVAGVPAAQLPGLAVRLSRAAGHEVDLIDVESAPPLLKLEIARDGVPVVERVAYDWVDFKARAMVAWWDWAPMARRFGAAAMARLTAGER